MLSDHFSLRHKFRRRNLYRIEMDKTHKKLVIKYIVLQ